MPERQAARESYFFSRCILVEIEVIYVFCIFFMIISMFASCDREEGCSLEEMEVIYLSFNIS